jgi:hypothetical protein
MADKDQETLSSQDESAPIDDWAAAFAALDQKDEKPIEEPADSGDDRGYSGDIRNPETADQGENTTETQGNDGLEPEDVPGGPGDLGGTDGEEDEDLGVFDLEVTEEEIKGYRDKLMQDIQDRTITDVAQAYIKQGARNTNGRLGATINDPDVCKRDRDGVPRFYNPDTGREFTGDNPRRQAQEWVDDYNKELADNFNRTCQQYSQRLLDQEQGKLAVIEFAPKYKALDPVRRAMLESIIEDYEVTDDNGDVVAYSCDLDKALAAVDRQVSVIKRRFAGQAQVAPTKPEPTGPVLDTPSTNGGTQDGKMPQFKSIAEAMEWEQDQLLAKMRGSKR